MNKIFSEAMGYYQNNPRVSAQITAGLAGKFAWKVDDGDTPDHRSKEGYAGCYIFKFSTTLGIPQCFDRENRPMDPALIKRGYYAEVFATCAPNELPDINAGVYLNPDMVRFAAYGPEIASGPTVEEAFGAAPPAVPPGGSLTPFGQAQAQPPAVAHGFGQGAVTQAAQSQPQAQAQAQGNPFNAVATGPNPQQPQGFAPAAAQVAQGQGFGVNAGWAGHGQQTGTAYPGNPQTFPGT
jgi:hypothetical protein